MVRLTLVIEEGTGKEIGGHRNANATTDLQRYKVGQDRNERITRTTKVIYLYCTVVLDRGTLTLAETTRLRTLRSCTSTTCEQRVPGCRAFSLPSSCISLPASQVGRSSTCTSYGSYQIHFRGGCWSEFRENIFSNDFSVVDIFV